MAKRPPQGRCVHCLKDGVDRNWDHVFPEAWYPDTTSHDLYKWQIPRCERCNREYGVMEDDMLLRLALTVDPKAPETSGIVAKALRSIKPEAGKTERDRSARAARAARLGSELIDGPTIPMQSVYPGLGERWGRLAGSGIGIPIPAKSFRRLTEKIVRGIYFIEHNKFIEPPYVIEFSALSDEDAEPINALMQQYGREYAREPGIIVRLAFSEEDPMSSLVEISVWGQVKMYASVLPEP